MTSFGFQPIIEQNKKCTKPCSLLILLLFGVLQLRAQITQINPLDTSIINESHSSPFGFVLLQSNWPSEITERMLIPVNDVGEWQILDKDLQIYQWKFPLKIKTEVDSLLNSSLFLSPNWKIQRGGGKVKRRIKQPNDPDYLLQQHLPLIQMPNAWEVGTNSVTEEGDTAVIAIIDDGVDTSHLDMINNLWHNPKEIPWNGIDEDSNGYVDDVYGWNGGDRNPIVFNRESVTYGHGTMVASVMAAQGNNNRGVSGLFWNTKLLITLCYPSDFTPADIGVVNSMIYIYRQKKLYLETRGKSGANIVAVNMSIGVDQGTVMEFPIWCSMYDSFSSVGIMCAASTTNANFDVGVRGDIPSLCPSNSLIVVSSTDINKQHVGCGYSREFVDLAAMGESVYMARPNKGSIYPYQYESGTSFCSPQVTATMAWLYSRSCRLYHELMVTKPDSGIQLMRSWLLQGVEKNSDLEKYTASGGFLQVFNAWNLMNQWCNKNDTSYHFNLQVNRIIGFMPNPVMVKEVSTVRFSHDSKPVGWSLVDFMGREVIPRHVSGSYYHDNQITELKFLMPEFVSAGNYVWRLYFEDGSHLSHRIVVLH